MSINVEHPDTSNYKIPDELGKKAQSYMSIKLDLEEVHQCLTELLRRLRLNLLDEVINSSLWKSAMITYGKCFTQSMDGHPKLNVETCFREAEFYLLVHLTLMKVRHGYIAYRGINEFEEAIIFFKIDKNHPEYIEFGIKSHRANNQKEDALMDYIKVVEHLQSDVEQILEIHLQKIYNSFQNDFSAEKLAEYLIKS